MEHKSAHELVKQLVEDWPEFGGDTPVNGTDLVGYIATWWRDATEYLEATD